MSSAELVAKYYTHVGILPTNTEFKENQAKIEINDQ